MEEIKGDKCYYSYKVGLTWHGLLLRFSSMSRNSTRLTLRTSCKWSQGRSNMRKMSEVTMLCYVLWEMWEKYKLPLCPTALAIHPVKRHLFTFLLLLPTATTINACQDSHRVAEYNQFTLLRRPTGPTALSPGPSKLRMGQVLPTLLPP